MGLSDDSFIMKVWIALADEVITVPWDDHIRCLTWRCMPNCEVWKFASIYFSSLPRPA